MDSGQTIIIPYITGIPVIFLDDSTNTNHPGISGQDKVTLHIDI